MKSIINYLINESRAEDHLDFKSILDDFLVNTDIKNWSTQELYEYCNKEEDLSNQEYDEFEKWVLKNYKKLFNASYSIKDKENYQKELKNKNKNKKYPTFKFEDSFGNVIKYLDEVIFFDADSKTFKKGRMVDLDKKHSIGTIILNLYTMYDKPRISLDDLPKDNLLKVEQFYILKD